MRVLRKGKFMSVEEMANELGVGVMTARLLLRDGKFGIAIKGKGNHYIYLVNENEVRKWKGENNCITLEKKK